MGDRRNELVLEAIERSLLRRVARDHRDEVHRLVVVAMREALRFADGAAFAMALDRGASEWLASSTPRLEAAPRSDAPGDVAHPDADPDASTPREKLRVLVVDDVDKFRRFATRAVPIALHGTPLSLVGCASGAQAIAHAKKTPPQLLLLDYNMEGLDGIATLSRLRALPPARASSSSARGSARRSAGSSACSASATSRTSPCSSRSSSS